VPTTGPECLVHHLQNDIRYMIQLATMCNGTTDNDPHGEWVCLPYCQGQRVLTTVGNGGLLLVGVIGSSITTYRLQTSSISSTA